MRNHHPTVQIKVLNIELSGMCLNIDRQIVESTIIQIKRTPSQLHIN